MLVSYCKLGNLYCMVPLSFNSKLGRVVTIPMYTLFVSL